MPKKVTVKPKEDMELQCAYRPKGGNMVDNIPCCASLHDKMAFKLVVFIAVFLLDAADLVSDWLLYHDVSATEEGLVYGPTEDELRYSLLVFSIIGSLTFTFEIANLWWEIFRNDPWMDVDLLSAITVWIEDVPQITINVFIAACREEAISYFQLVKASIIIFGAFVRIIVSLVRYCNKKSRQDLQCAKVNKDSLRHVIYRAFIMIGLILTLGGAITVFLFTQSERNPDGTLNFKVPHSLIEGEYDDRRYFGNVSVYFSHKLFDYGTTPKSESDTNLLRLLTIDEIKKHESDRTIRIKYIDQPISTVVIQVSDRVTDECFEIDRTNKILNILPNCSSVNPVPTTEIIITFHYTKPSVPKLLFGDIKYDMKVKNLITGNCTNPKFNTENEVSAHTQNDDVAALHYFRTNQGLDNSHHVKYITSSTAQFYQSSGLEDILQVWKTGFAYCESSGSKAPHHDGSIHVLC